MVRRVAFHGKVHWSRWSAASPRRDKSARPYRQSDCSRRYPEIDRRSEIYPVVVTYDDVGGDNLGTNSWIELRCREEGLLQGPRENAVTMIDVRGFEVLMALASRGMSVPKLLAEKTSSVWRRETLDVYLSHRKITIEQARLAHLDVRFAELSDARPVSLGSGDRAARSARPP